MLNLTFKIHSYNLKSVLNTNSNYRNYIEYDTSLQYGNEMMNIPQQQKVSNHTHILFVTLILAILGTHLLGDNIYVLVIASLFFIDWEKIVSKETILVALFLLTVYIIWFLVDHDVLFKMHIAIKVVSELLLILCFYLLGNSIHYDPHDQSSQSIRYIFYLLFGFFIAYTSMIIYSYIAIKQDHPLTSYGLYVNFPNEYKRLHVNGGRLISTIIAYYLTISSFLFSYFIIFFDRFKKKKIFSIWEMIIFITIALFSLYVAVLMGRRTTLMLFFTVFTLLLFVRFLFDSTYKEKGIIILLLVLLSIVTYHFFEDFIQRHFMYIYNKLMVKGIHDVRFSFWIPGLEAMLAYPFGGGHGVFVAHGIRLAHNTWIDIGKDFGVIPFTLFVMICVLHLYYFIRILFSPSVNIFLKYQLLIILCGMIPILMIEPVFTSDKLYIAYLFFVFGFITHLYKHNKNV